MAEKIRPETRRVFFIRNVGNAHWVLWVLSIDHSRSAVDAFYYNCRTFRPKQQEKAQWQTEVTQLEELVRQIKMLNPLLQSYTLHKPQAVLGLPKDNSSNDCGAHVLTYLKLAHEDKDGQHWPSAAMSGKRHVLFGTIKDRAQQMRDEVLRSILTALSSSPSSPPDPTTHQPLPGRCEQPDQSLDVAAKSRASAGHPQPPKSFKQPDVPLSKAAKRDVPPASQTSRYSSVLPFSQAEFRPSASACDSRSHRSDAGSEDDGDDAELDDSDDEIIGYAQKQRQASQLQTPKPAFQIFQIHDTRLKINASRTGSRDDVASNGGLRSSRSTRFYQKMLVTLVQQSPAVQQTNDTPCFLCCTLRTAMPNVVCTGGTPCLNAILMVKSHIAVPADVAATLRDEDDGVPCVACALAGDWTCRIYAVDLHAMSETSTPCTPSGANLDTSDSSERHSPCCVSMLHPAIPAELLDQVPLSDYPTVSYKTIKDDQGTTYLDTVCPLSFETESQLKHHAQMHAFGMEQSCLNCWTQLPSWASSQQHFTPNPSSTKKHPCDPLRRNLDFPGQRVEPESYTLPTGWGRRLDDFRSSAEPVEAQSSQTPSSMSRFNWDDYNLVVVVTRFSSGSNAACLSRDDVFRSLKIQLTQRLRMPHTVAVVPVVCRARSWSTVPVLDTIEAIRDSLRGNVSLRGVLVVVRGLDGWSTNSLAPRLLSAWLPPDCQVDLLIYHNPRMNLKTRLPGFVNYTGMLADDEDARWLLVSMSALAVHSVHKKCDMQQSQIDQNRRRTGMSKREVGMRSIVAQAVMDLWIVISHSKRPWGEEKQSEKWVYAFFAGTNRNALE
ncbi:MAG: hypothetical protein Q9159_005735 [Coniocarpon cinnabarinum]